MHPNKTHSDEFDFPNYQWDNRVKLGQGSYGIVYKVQEKTTGEYHAIKQFDMKLFQGPAIQALESQINIMKELQHEHLARMINYKIGKHYTYVIMQLCDSDLRKKLEANGNKISETEAIASLAQIMKGFQFMVKKGYLHRDIKPQNTLIRKSVYKVADFGFSVKADINCITKINEICGSPLYMAPQLLCDEPYTAKSDIWSIGIMFFEMIFGYSPWPSRSLEMYKDGILRRPLAFPYDARIGENTRDFIKKCLVVREESRIGWDKIFDHPLIHLNDAGQKIQTVKIDPRVIDILKRIQTSANRKGTSLNKVFDSATQENLNKEKFSELLRQLDPSVSSIETHMLFTEIDRSKDGLVSVQEVKTILAELDFRDAGDIAARYIHEIIEIAKQRKLNLPEFFRECDRDKNGKIGLSEFEDMIRKLLPRMASNDIRKIYEMFDKDKSGDISLQEFLSEVTEGVPGQGDNQQNPPPTAEEPHKSVVVPITEKKIVEGVKPELNAELARRALSSLKLAIKYYGVSMKELFTFFDTNTDSRLDFKEFTNLVYSVDKFMPEDEVRLMFQSIDRDASGWIIPSEFKAFLA